MNKLRAFALGLTMVAASSGANAAIQAGGTITDGGNSFSGPISEVFLWVADLNGATDQTLLVDLGINSDFDFNGQDYSQQIDLTGFGSTPLADLAFGVVTGAWDNGSGTLGLWFTAAAGFANDIFASGTDVPKMTNAQLKIGELVNQPEHSDGNFANDEATFASGVGSAVIPGGLNYNGEIEQVSNGAALGESLSFYSSIFNGSGFTNSELGAGRSWTLSLGGLLEWKAGGAPIPLPAGVWLLGSVLLGLVGVARRKKLA